MQGLISILIPVFNAEETLKNAIESCLDQTYTQIEILILNNGSEDKSSEIMNSYKDPRIRIYNSARNIGIAKARNYLLKEAKGEFIAWLDADDTMLPHRLETQMAFMRENPQTDIAGSWIFTDNNELPRKRLPVDPAVISACLWYKNCLVQPSVLSRNFYAAEGIYYDETFLNSVEDYELWYRLRDTKTFANVPEFLTVYHMTIGIAQDMKKRNNEFESNLHILWKKKWKDKELKFHDQEKEYFQNFLYSNRTLTIKELNAISKILNSLRKQDKSACNQMIVGFHTLRLWRNMKFTHKLINLHLLVNFKYYPALKRIYLIG